MRWERTRWHHDRWSCFYRQQREAICWCALWPRNLSLSSILHILCTQIAHLSLSSPSLRCFFHRRMGIEGNIVIGHGLKVFQRSQKSQPTPSLSSLSLPLTLCLVANGGRKKKRKIKNSNVKCLVFFSPPANQTAEIQSFPYSSCQESPK